MLSLEAMKANFLDRAKVDKALDKPVREVMTRFGAFVRKDAKDSIKKARRKRVGELPDDARKKFRAKQRLHKKMGWKKPILPYLPSEPGKPPRFRRANSGIKKVLFAYDRTSRSVVIGPTGDGGKSRGKTTSVLEFGGKDRSRFTVFKWKRVGGKRKRVRKRISKRVTIAPRPYMNPAFRKNVPLLRKWKSEIKG